MSGSRLVVAWLLVAVSVGQILVGVMTLAWPHAAPPWRRRFTASRLWGWARIVSGIGCLLIVSYFWADQDGLGLALMPAGYAVLITSNFMDKRARASRVPEPEPEPIDPPAGAEQYGVLY